MIPTDFQSLLIYLLIGAGTVISTLYLQSRMDRKEKEEEIKLLHKQLESRSTDLHQIALASAERIPVFHQSMEITAKATREALERLTKAVADVVKSVETMDRTVDKLVMRIELQPKGPNP